MPKKVFCGTVTKAKCDKTVKVSVLQVYKDELYKKVIKNTRSIQHMMRIIVVKKGTRF
jgi:ribosomal protein S17